MRFVKLHFLALIPPHFERFFFFFTFVVDDVLSVVSCSLQTGSFPSSRRPSMVRPLLKIWAICYNLLKTVSNLTFLKKQTEIFVYINISMNREVLLSLSSVPCVPFTPRPTEPFFVFQVALLDQEPLAGWSRQLRMVSLIPNPAQRWL